MANEKVLSFRIDITGVTAESKEIAELDAQLTRLGRTRKQIMDYERAGVKLTSRQKKELAGLSQATRQLQARKAELNKTERASARELTTVAGSMANLRAQTSKLVAEANNLNTTNAKGQKRLKQIQLQVDRNKKSIRDFDRSMSGSKTLVGEYGMGIKQSMAAISGAIFGVMAALRSLRGVWNLVAKDFAEFETGQLNIQSLLDDFDDTLSSRTINLMSKYGLAVADTNKALFDAVSAGVPAAEATEFMAASAKLAIAGVTDLTTATDGLTSVINSYRLDTSEASEVADAFFTAQKFGKTTVAELAQNIGQVAPIAKQANFGYRELLATYAELTKQGIKTDLATTAIKASITALIKPTVHSAKEFRRLGIESGLANIRQNGLMQTIYQVSQAVEKDADALTKLIPNVRALTGVAALSTDALADYDKILNEVYTDTGEAGSAQKALSEHMESVNKQLDISQAKWKAARIEMGQELKPALTTLLQGFTNLIEGENRFINFLSTTATKALTGFGVNVNKVNRDIKKILDEMPPSIEETSEAFGQLSNVNIGTEPLIDFGRKADEIAANTLANNIQREKETTEMTEDEMEARLKIIEDYAKEVLRIQEGIQVDSAYYYLKDLEAFYNAQLAKEAAKTAAREAARKGIAPDVEEGSEEVETEIDRELDILMRTMQATSEYRAQKNQADYDNGLVTYQEYIDKKAQIEAEGGKKTQLISAKNMAFVNGGLTAGIALVTALETAQLSSKQKELEAAGDNEEKKAEIEKKYAKKKQKSDVARAVIATALAVLNALNTQPFILGLIMAGVAATAGAIQIANIKKQKFAGGGKVKSGNELPTSTPQGDNTLALVKPNEVILNEQQQAIIGGADVFRAAGVPGFAAGGITPDSSSSITQGLGANLDIGLLGGVIAENMNNLKVIQNVNELNSSQRELEVIQETEAI